MARSPKLRQGSYFPSFLDPCRRAGQALVVVVQEAYINGVSTRKVDRLVEQMGRHLTKDQVSRLCRGLDEQVSAFRERPLEGRYPYPLQRDEWLVSRRYLSQESLSAVLAEDDHSPKEIKQEAPSQRRLKDNRLTRRTCATPRITT